MLKLLIDENVGRVVINDLRSIGYDVKSVFEEHPGLDDLSILILAKREKRIIVTLDKDFGKLIFLNSNKHCGVIFMRLKDESCENISLLLINILKSYKKDELENRFVTVSEDNVRFKL